MKLIEMPKRKKASKELKTGQKVEMEHKDTLGKVKGDPTMPLKEATTHIAKDHLKELPDYYTRLKKMEQQAKVEKAGAAEPGYYDPEQIKIKREDEAAKRGEPGEITDDNQDQPSYEDQEAADPALQEAAKQKAEDKAAEKSIAKAGFGPGGGITGSEVSPVDTGEDYTPKTSRGDEIKDPLEFHQPDQPPEWVEVGPTRGGENQFKPWSEVVGAKVPMIGHPYHHLRQFTDPEEREKERQLLARSMEKAVGDQPQEAPPQETQPEGSPQGEVEIPEEDPQAVMAEGQKLLSMVPKLSEAQLRMVAKRIWGDDYEYPQGATEEYVREHVTGSIMDMLDRALRVYREGELGEEME